MTPEAYLDRVRDLIPAIRERVDYTDFETRGVDQALHDRLRSCRPIQVFGTQRRGR